MPSHHHPWPRQNPSGQASLHPDYACSAGIPSGSEVPWVQLYAQGPRTERGVPQFVGEEAETSSAPSSKSERGGGRRSSRFSQELDTKPGGKRKLDTYLSACRLIYLGVHILKSIPSLTSCTSCNCCLCVYILCLVRLSSCPADSSESSRESSQVSREKRGRSRRTSSDRERRSSQQ